MGCEYGLGCALLFNSFGLQELETAEMLEETALIKIRICKTKNVLSMGFEFAVSKVL